jgi:hypothetical protein
LCEDRVHLDTPDFPAILASAQALNDFLNGKGYEGASLRDDQNDAARIDVQIDRIEKGC